MISWLYSMVELVDGRLPWGAERDATVVKRKKMGTSDRLLLKSFPSEILEIWRYLNQLKYSSRVNYEYIFCLLVKSLHKCENGFGAHFDWEFLSPEEIVKYSAIPNLPKGIDYKEEPCTLEFVAPYEHERTNCACAVC
jgi:hypothetical protein